MLNIIYFSVFTLRTSSAVTCSYSRGFHVVDESAVGTPQAAATNKCFRIRVKATYKEP